jgi:hypothetical protein
VAGAACLAGGWLPLASCMCRRQAAVLCCAGRRCCAVLRGTAPVRHASPCLTASLPAFFLPACLLQEFDVEPTRTVREEFMSAFGEIMSVRGGSCVNGRGPETPVFALHLRTV